jgi:mono/diheme cytochrome c family protein
MKKIFKWIGFVLAALVGLVLLAAFAFFLQGNSRLNKTYTIPIEPISLPTDADSLARGERWATAMCTSCHGSDLGGVKNWFNAGPLGSFDSANLTAGQGGIGQEFKSVDDYVRALRHGVDPEGKPIYMPAVVSVSRMSDQDLGAMIAYLQTVSPVDRETSGQNFSPLAKILIGAGLFGKLPVEEVDHAGHVDGPAADVTVDYGQYLVEVGDCKACHGQQLAGGAFPDPAVTAPAPNLTPGGDLAGWEEAQFIAVLRTGMTPDGRSLNNEYMPWSTIGGLTDDELKAIWLYLQSLPELSQAN